MTRPYDLVGRKFGRLSVLCRSKDNDSHGNAVWETLCECGSLVYVSSNKLLRLHTKSCGCLGRDMLQQRNEKHGHASRAKKSREYHAWRSMNSRCYKQSDKSYRGYGALGVKVCDSWRHDFKEFLAYMGECPDNYELDRIDNAQGYFPGNVRWVTETAQSRNRRYCKLSVEKAAQIRASGRSKKELAAEYGVSVSTIEGVLTGRSWR